MNRFIERLLPERLRKKPELEKDERLLLWRNVPDEDKCLKAVIDVAEDLLEGNFSVAIDPERPVEQRLRAIERAGIVWQLLNDIEKERDAAKAELARERRE